jgi:hypothetical protein
LKRKPQTIVMGVAFDCPACDGGRVSMNQSGVTTHSEPPCERWNKLDTLEEASDFMREARLKDHSKSN